MALDHETTKISHRVIYVSQWFPQIKGSQEDCTNKERLYRSNVYMTQDTINASSYLGFGYHHFYIFNFLFCLVIQLITYQKVIFSVFG